LGERQKRRRVQAKGRKLQEIFSFQSLGFYLKETAEARKLEKASHSKPDGNRRSERNAGKILMRFFAWILTIIIAKRR
jgi:hypothetical protein